MASGRTPVGDPARMFQGRRPLKRWRYVGVFAEQLMACAATVHVGPAGQSFWALYARGDGRLRERTLLLRRRGVELDPGPPRALGGSAATSGSAASVRAGAAGVRAAEGATGRLEIRDGDVALELQLHEHGGIEALCRHGRGVVWTRKQAGVAAHGTLALDGGRAQAIDARAVIDDTVGYHARHTEWWWSAGVGEAPDGAALAWNLVSGVNDPPSGSERAVWIAGEAREAARVTFAPDLRAIVCEDGSELSFEPEAERARRDNLVIVRSDYRAPFGTFSGTLPGGIALARGLGVVEHHRAVW